MSSQFAEAVREELDRARTKHGHRPINSVHEGYAVILEELEEFWAEVMKKAKDRDRRNMAKELAQIAAMCQRTAEDCGLVNT